jgi:4-diphosphocytidyl-2-C-methyl-D-erythritol kinase
LFYSKQFNLYAGLRPKIFIEQHLKAIYDLAAPAKLNLFLHVTGQRADGFHLLQSVFVHIDWADKLHLEWRGDGVIERSDANPSHLPAQDLCVRAAHALKNAWDGAHSKLGAQIHLRKNLPSEAGMGGGSSDAATVLLGLRKLWTPHAASPAPRDADLASIGATLGADVPFFLGQQNAWVEGIGEHIAPLPRGLELAGAKVLVIKPAAGVSTPKIFQDPALKRDSKPAILAGFAAQPFLFGKNDLQPVAQAHCAEIGQAIEWCKQHGLNARMTGSGSAVFASLQMPPKEDYLSDLPANWTARECSILAQHPLVGW